MTKIRAAIAALRATPEPLAIDRYIVRRCPGGCDAVVRLKINESISAEQMRALWDNWICADCVRRGK